MSLGESNDNVEYVSEVQDVISDEEEGEITAVKEEVKSGASWRYLSDDEEEVVVKKKKVKKGTVIVQEQKIEEENGNASGDLTPKGNQIDEIDNHKNKRPKHDNEQGPQETNDSISQPTTPQPPPPPPEDIPPPPPPDTNTNTNTSDTNPPPPPPNTNNEEPKEEVVEPPRVLLRQNLVTGCRHVDNFKRLNKIEEGTYGVVYRAQDKETGEIVALKKLKMDREKEGFPITSLREIKILLTFKHPNIVDVREVAVGNNLNSIFIVMEYVDHDIKTLMEEMPKPFLPSEVKNLLKQLLEGMAHLHDNWVLHRDLKTSNLLYNNKGMLKIADFGLAREYGSPLKPYSLNIVTLWYRAPELLLGCKQYTTAVDMWSVGCIFAEFISKQALLQGRTEIDQIDKIFRLLGTANDKIWPGFSQLPNAKKMSFVNQPYNNLRQKFPPQTLTEAGFDLLNKFLTYDPKKRITAADALKHPYFSENPPPKDSALMPTWPASHDGIKRKRPLDDHEIREQQRERELQQQSEQDRYKQNRDRSYKPAPAPGPFVLKGTAPGFGFK